VEAIKSADIIPLEQLSELDYWKSFIGNKEIWYCPHGERVGLGPDSKAIQEASAAVKMSPAFGYHTNSVIVTMDDWPDRKKSYRDGSARCHNRRKRKGGIPIAFSATTHCLSCHKS
jgi:hypothetical protein